jgi:transcriptional regulator with XRE-family HTH domain
MHRLWRHAAPVTRTGRRLARQGYPLAVDAGPRRPYIRCMRTPLGDFIRARRDATGPASLGLPAGPRRRVLGLRRSELAALAGISVEYLVRIEQGADSNPSPSVLIALADALALDASDRARLRHLADIADGCPASSSSAQPPYAAVRSGVLALLDQLEPGAAMVVNRLGDILAYTAGFEAFASASALLDSSTPNLTRFVFTDARSRTVFPDWDEIADHCAANLWFGPTGQQAIALAEELAAIAGPAFTDRLHRHPPPSNAAMRWLHPTAGELRLHREVLELAANDAQQLVVFQPADRDTSAALLALRSAATPLRAAG